MPITIALAGNPNSGKTTLFNTLTGLNQFVGNWPGVTIEKKEGHLKGHKDVIITDLPGIYSLSPYTLEEVISRNYLIDKRPEVILNIVDGTNLERNLFLTTQLTELGIPVVVAINMMDLVRKNKDKINTTLLAKKIGCKVIEISALKQLGIKEVIETVIKAASSEKTIPIHSFTGGVEHTLAHIEEAALHKLPQEEQRFFAIKLFERDKKIIEKLKLTPVKIAHIEDDIKRREIELDDDSESIITSERYSYIDSIVKDCIKLHKKGRISLSDKIDKIVTNRYLALPIFILVMFIVYFVSVTTVGTMVTDFVNDGVFGEGIHFPGTNTWMPSIPILVTNFLESINCANWLISLIVDGIILGVGAVLGFVPQMLILFIFLAFLEGCGYMARIAFIMDRIFRRFGLSGKSFIPILIGTGCGVPGIMASRTVENDRDRKLTIMTTTFIPCGAKLPIIALIAGAMFNGAWWVAVSSYFIGILAIVCSGIILKKTRMFAGDVAPFVMELPTYHMPTLKNILRSMWERGWSFIKKAGTIILLTTIVIWFVSNYGYTSNYFGVVEMPNSILAKFASWFAWVFTPLGWGNWKAAAAAITGLVAKENIVGTLGILFGFSEVAEDGAQIWTNMAQTFTPISAYSFLIFNLLCAPCFAAIGAIKREMNNKKWFWFAILYQTLLAYAVSLVFYQLGMLFFTRTYDAWLIVAILLVMIFLFLLLKRRLKPQSHT